METLIVRLTSYPEKYFYKLHLGNNPGYSLQYQNFVSLFY